MNSDDARPRAKLLSRRSLLCSAPLSVAAAAGAVGMLPQRADAADCVAPEVLGQGAFRYKANRYWGRPCGVRRAVGVQPDLSNQAGVDPMNVTTPASR